MQLEFSDLDFSPIKLPSWFLNIYFVVVGTIVIMEIAFIAWTVHLTDEECEILRLPR